jgi:hypothetical protein
MSPNPASLPPTVTVTRVMVGSGVDGIWAGSLRPDHSVSRLSVLAPLQARWSSVVIRALSASRRRGQAAAAWWHLSPGRSSGGAPSPEENESPSAT